MGWSSEQEHSTRDNCRPWASTAWFDASTSVVTRKEWKLLKRRDGSRRLPIHVRAYLPGSDRRITLAEEQPIPSFASPYLFFPLQPLHVFDADLRRPLSKLGLLSNAIHTNLGERLLDAATSWDKSGVQLWKRGWNAFWNLLDTISLRRMVLYTHPYPCSCSCSLG